MKQQVQIIALAIMMMTGAFASAQVLPWTINVSGTFANCSPSSFVTIQTPISVPNVNFNVTLNSDCSFSTSFQLADSVGYVQFSYPCQGAIQNMTVPFSCGFSDSAFVTVVLDCNNAIVDCQGVTGGSALPGTPCDDNDPLTSNDTWSADCVCAGEVTTPGDCSAGFWVLQGYTLETVPGDPNTPDSTIVLPIPNELWVWNLSTGSDSFDFLWSFGDGTSSTEAFPSHIYAGSGPYELCLTVTDPTTGCTDTYCESISVDGDGIIQGMGMQHEVAAGSDRSAMTLNVVSEQPLVVTDKQLTNDLQLWPNPVHDRILLSISTSRQDKMTTGIYDMSGNLVRQMGTTLRTGNNRIEMEVNDLLPGIYVLRIGNGTTSTSRRFVKQ